MSTEAPGAAPPPPTGARLTVDPDALAANWRILAARAPAAECAAAVKADAYGVGLDAAVPALWAAGCRTYFVAYLAEAQRVRALAPDAVIYALNGLADRLDLYAALRIRPVLGSPEDIERWRGFVRATGWAGPAAIHFDTGINRLGLPHQLPVDTDGLALSLVMSHLACADEPDHPLNALQIDRFRARAAGFPGTPLSLANSSGLFLREGIGFDLARPGYAIYGGNPTPGRSNPMRDVVRLEARILQIRELEEGDTVGYGATWQAVRRSRIAVLGIGYADGFPRAGSSGGTHEPALVTIAGRPCPVVGRISMDLTAVDVTAVPAAAVHPGDGAEILGPTQPVDDVARRAGTIGYELLTRLGRRFERAAAGAGVERRRETG